MSSNDTLLQVRDLRTYFDTEDGLVKAVDGVSFSIDSGETFALVGESGCGKSVTAFSIMRIVSNPGIILRNPDQETFEGDAEPIPDSRILLEGENLLDYTEGQMRQVRGSRISMIFQEPMSSLNPVFTCGNQIVEAIRLHQNIRGAKADQLAIEMLAKVGIPDPAQRFREYPHQMSGGMKQRVMIAMALSCNPKLLIADEPTTALDVTIQAQILDLVRGIQQASDLAVMLITHDLAVVAETAHRVGVMYASKMAEMTDVTSLFNDPLHPYTQGLFRSLPRLGARTPRLETIPGNVPNPLNFPTGCKFHPRCPIGRSLPQCRKEEPPLKQVRPDHWCACWQCPGYDEVPPPVPDAPDGSSD